MCPCRVTREGKERRKRWAQRRASSKPDKKAPKEVEDEDTKQSEENEETNTMPGMLPTSVIEILAAREKYVHFSCQSFFIKIFVFDFDFIGYLVFILHSGKPSHQILRKKM